MGLLEDPESTWQAGPRVLPAQEQVSSHSPGQGVTDHELYARERFNLEDVHMKQELT